MLKVANLNFFILLEVNFVEIKTFIITLNFQENFWFLLFSYVDVFVTFIIFDYWYFLFLFLFSCRIWGIQLPLPPALPHTYLLLCLVYFYLIQYYSFAIHLLYSIYDKFMRNQNSFFGHRHSDEWCYISITPCAIMPCFQINEYSLSKLFIIIFSFLVAETSLLASTKLPTPRNIRDNSW